MMQPHTDVATVPSFYQGHARERDGRRSIWCYDMCSLGYRSSEEWSLINNIHTNPLIKHSGMAQPAALSWSWTSCCWDVTRTYLMFPLQPKTKLEIYF